MASDLSGSDPSPKRAGQRVDRRGRTATDRASGFRAANVSRGLREHVERSPVAIAVVDAEQYVVRYANPAFRLLVGSGERLAGRQAVADAVPHSGSEAVAALLRSVSETGEPASDVEIEHRGTDPAACFWSVTVWPVPPRGDQARELVLQIRDTTEEVQARRRRAELTEQLREINQRLLFASVREEDLRAQAQAASAAKSAFLATMSHELRTPLTAIMGYQELLSDSITGPVNDAQRAQLARIKRSAAHLLALIDEVLTLSSVEASRETIRRTPVILRELADEVVLLVAPLTVSKGLALETTVADAATTLATDPLKVRQILVNLLGNAVKFSDRGAIVLAVSLEPEMARFDVHDSGIGIAPEHIERVFDPFWQVRQTSNREVGGSGLGLTVCRRLARLLGGDVTVKSVLGEGSTFTLRLPLRAPVEPDDN